MLAHILRHVPFELAGNIDDWLRSQNATVTETHFWESYSLPHAGDLDLLVILGGPMSANDETMLPWLVEEKMFIRDAIAYGVPTLGICLGSQLIASAHGARVYKNKFAEHGWFDVEGIAPPKSEFAFPKKFAPFHSHGETFDLPPGAVHLARSHGCEHQAFQIGERCLGLQFHLESTIQSASAIVEECGAEFGVGPYVMTKTEMRRARKDYGESRRVMFDVLDYLTR